MNINEAYELEIARYIRLKRTFFELQLHVQTLKKEMKATLKGMKQIELLLAYETKNHINKEEKK